MKRNASIELFRLLLIFGICLLHSAINPGYSRAWFINITCFCVTAFAFISGYYGVSFRPSKIARLVGTGIICALICRRGDISRAWGIYGGYWFLHAYVLMMCLAPLVDGALSRKGAIAVTMPLLVAIFVWGDLPALPIFCKLNIPVTPGLEAYSGLTLLGAYAAARIYRLYGLERIRPAWIIISVPILFVLAALGMNEYQNIVSLLLSAVLFALFSRITLPAWMVRGILLMSPSVFAIYLLHQPEIDFEVEIVKSCVDAGCNIYIAYHAAALTVFFLALSVDVPRRVATWLMRSILTRVYKLIDGYYDGILIWIDGCFGKVGGES